MSLEMWFITIGYITLFIDFICSNYTIFILKKQRSRLLELIEKQTTIIQCSNELLKNEGYEISSKVVTEEI